MEDETPEPAYHLPCPPSGTLTVLKHYHLDLVDEAIEAFRKQSEQNDQNAAKLKEWFARFHSAVDQDIDDACIEASNDTTVCMQEGMKLIGSTFLFGALDDVSVTWNEAQKGFGCTKGWGESTRVELRFLPSREECDDTPLHEHILGTMLHESVHVILGKFSCGTYFCEDRSCMDSKRVEIGEEDSEHALAFQKLAMAIEEESERFFGVSIDLGRVVGAQCETDFLTPRNIHRFFGGIDPRDGTRVASP